MTNSTRRRFLLFILPLTLTLSSLTSVQAADAWPQTKSAAERQTPTPSTTEPNKALVLKWVDALRGTNKDMAAAQALVTEDWTIHGAGANFSRGPEGLKQWQGYIDAMWSVSRPPTTEDIMAEGDRVVRRTTVYRTWRSNNKESAMTVVFIYRITGGRIAEVWRAADALSSYRQIGARIIMPGANADAGQASSAPAIPEKIDTPHRATPSEGTNERNKALVARWAEAIWNRDLAEAQALVTDDWVIHGAGSDYPRGPEGVKQWQAAIDSSWSYGGSTTDDTIAEGDKVARRTTVFAMYKPNHRGTVTSVVFIYRVADGKIAEVWRVANYVATDVQAGARIMMPGAKPEDGQAASAKAEAEEEVLRAKQQCDAAALGNDADGRARFYSDDYVIVYSDGTLGDKPEQLARVRSGRLRYVARQAEDVIVRLYGDTAVVIERRRQTATFDGQPRPSDVRATEVWIKREGGWRLVATHTTPVRDPISGPLLPGRAAGQTTGTTDPGKEPLQAETRAEMPNGASQAEREVLRARMEEDEATRRNDVDALARFYADDYLFVTYAGTLTNREYQLEAFRSGFMRIPVRTQEDVIVHIYGDTAVVISHRRQVATVAGRTRSPEQRATSIWVKRQGQWQVVSAQVTPILEPARAQTPQG